MAIESKEKMSLVGELYGESPFPKTKMTPQLGSTLKQLKSKIGIGNSGVIVESPDILNNSGSEDE
jgi:hypothetical protein